MCYNIQILSFKHYYHLHNQNRRTHFFILLCKTWTKRLSHSLSIMKEVGKNKFDKENITKHDVWNSITTGVDNRMSSTMKTETVMKPYVNSLANYNHQVKHDLERSKKKKLEMGSLMQSSLQETKEENQKDSNMCSNVESDTLNSKIMEEYNLKIKSTILKNYDGRYIMNPDSTKELDLPDISQAKLSKRKRFAKEGYSKNKKTKQNEVSKNDAKEAFPDSSTSLFEGIPSPSLEVLTNLAYNCNKTPFTYTAAMNASFSQKVPNMGRIRVRSTQELCSSEWSTPLLQSVPMQVNDLLSDHLPSSSQQAQISASKDCYNSKYIPASSIVSNSSSSSSFTSRHLGHEHGNISTTTEHSNSVFSLGQQQPKKKYISNAKQMSNSASSSSSSSRNFISSSNSSLIYSNSPQRFSRAVQNKSTSNFNHRTYLTNLLQAILNSIRSLKAFYKCSLTLNQNQAQQYFFENIMQLKKLFEKLAIHENQTFSKNFIDYSIQKLCGLNNSEFSLSSYEVDCILAFQPSNVNNLSSQSLIILPSATVNSSFVMNKTKFTNLQKLIFKQQIESYKYITLWINDKLSKEKRFNNYQLNQVEMYTKDSRFVMNPNKTSFEGDKNLIFSVIDNSKVTNSDSDLTLHKTVLKTTTDKHNSESTIHYIGLTESDKMFEKIDQVTSLNDIKNSTQTCVTNFLLNNSLTANEDNNELLSRNTVIMRTSERSSTLNTVNKVECEVAEESSVSSNCQLKNVYEIRSLQEINNITTLEERIQNDSIHSIETKNLSIIVDDNKQNEVSLEDSFLLSTASATEVIEFVEKKFNPAIENASTIHDKAKSADEGIVNLVETSGKSFTKKNHSLSVVRLGHEFSTNSIATSDIESNVDSAQCFFEVAEQNSVIFSSETEPKESVPDPAHSTEFIVSTVSHSEELGIENKLENTSTNNVIQKDIVQLNQIPTTPSSSKTKSEKVQDKSLSNLNIITDIKIKTATAFECQNDHNNLHLPTQTSEIDKTVVKNSIAVLNQEVRNIVSENECCVEYTQDTSAYCYNRTQNETKVPEILMVQSISSDQFNELNSTENDCDDSDSDTSSNCSFTELNENACLLCNEESVFVCELCTKASYCSKMCQETHWEIVHHKTCRIRKTNDIICLD